MHANLATSVDDSARLGPTDCLNLWEEGRGLHALDRGLLVIHRALPQTRGEDVAGWPLGDRNRLLARVQCASFGPNVTGAATCPECREDLEFAFDVAQLAAHPGVEADTVVAVATERFRLPSTRDLASVMDVEDAALELARRCRLATPEVDAGIDPPWSDADLDRIGEQLALADPCAEILLAFDCPQCGAAFTDHLDLATFLWSEFESRARRLLGEVHALASAYGWREADILALTPARRTAYLEMVRA